MAVYWISMPTLKYPVSHHIISSPISFQMISSLEMWGGQDFQILKYSVFTFHIWQMSTLNPNGGGGGLIAPALFQTAISPWKKGSGGPKSRDFLIHYELSENPKKCSFHSVLGWFRRCRHIVPPHSSYIQKPRTIRVNEIAITFYHFTCYFNIFPCTVQW